MLTPPEIAMTALVVSLCSLLISFDLWRRSFRPIVTVAVKTHSGGNVAILYDLVVVNSGTLPAKDIRIQLSENALASAFGGDATKENKERWLACLNSVIPILHHNDRVSCSFGTTKINNTGFWKYDAKLHVTIKYRSWFGWSYRGEQEIQIADSDSFTGYSWGD
jgi:hypothetical protein